MVYVHVHYELGLHMITFLPQQPHIYDLTLENPISWMIRTLNAIVVPQICLRLSMLLVSVAAFQASLQPK